MKIRFGFVGTYPPTVCGLATFTHALYTELVTVGGDGGQVIRSLDAPQAHEHAAPARGQAGVCGELIAGDAGSVCSCAALLNRGDVVIVQHEYGVYGGLDGEEILQLGAAWPST